MSREFWISEEKLADKKRGGELRVAHTTMPVKLADDDVDLYYHVVEFSALQEAERKLEVLLKTTEIAMEQWRAHMEQDEQKSIQHIRNAEGTRWRECWESMNDTREALAQIGEP